MNPTNENCRGCGALITHRKCRHCGRLYDSKRDRLIPDPREDPKRHVHIRKELR